MSCRMGCGSENTVEMHRKRDYTLHNPCTCTIVIYDTHVYQISNKHDKVYHANVVCAYGMSLMSCLSSLTITVIE